MFSYMLLSHLFVRVVDVMFILLNNAMSVLFVLQIPHCLGLCCESNLHIDSVERLIFTLLDYRPDTDAEMWLACVTISENRT